MILNLQGSLLFEIATILNKRLWTRPYLGASVVVHKVNSVVTDVFSGTSKLRLFFRQNQKPTNLQFGQSEIKNSPLKP